jgi:pimeloyl-ACP methyl ester carboxylesterase
LEQALSFAARDGYELGAVLYGAQDGGSEAAQAAVFCCGGGIPARVYRRFAAWLAGRGIPVLAFDYRGIGRSRPPAMRGFAAAIEDWAELDCAAAIAWLRSRYPRAELIGIAHSVGGFVLASAPNAPELRRFLLIGVHTGYCGDYHPKWRIPMTLMWHYFMPALVRVVGYFPGRTPHARARGRRGANGRVPHAVSNSRRPSACAHFHGRRFRDGGRFSPADGARAADRGRTSRDRAARRGSHKHWPFRVLPARRRGYVVATGGGLARRLSMDRLHDNTMGMK